MKYYGLDSWFSNYMSIKFVDFIKKFKVCAWLLLDLIWRKSFSEGYHSGDNWSMSIIWGKLKG